MSSLLPIFVNAQNGPHAIDGGGATSESLSPVNKDQSTSSGQALAPAFSQVLREFNRTAAEKILGDFQPSQIQTSPEDFLPSATDSPVSLPLSNITSFDGLHTPARTLFQDSGFQEIGGDSTLGPVRQESELGGRILGIAKIPLPKALEAGSFFSQGSVPEEALSVRTVVPSAKDAPGGFQKVEHSVLGNETLQNPILSKVSSPLARPQNVQTTHMPPATAVQAEGPAGFTGPNLTQITVKSIPGNSSVLSDVPSQGIEHRTTVPADLLGETGLLAKGERGQTIIEASVKSMGLDPSGGQGLGNGMNHFSNSQSGFQQPSSFPGQGVGLRGLEERGQEFPAPALQRLQMDVQLSENQRVHIDVGVHNRQVYTGLVMDHSILRNLATQFVPQLENQLAEVDLELQEFSAEVHEEQKHEADSLFNDSRSHKAQESERRAQGELLSNQNPVGRQKEPGLHFVA